MLRTAEQPSDLISRRFGGGGGVIAVAECTARDIDVFSVSDACQPHKPIDSQLVGGAPFVRPRTNTQAQLNSDSSNLFRRCALGKAPDIDSQARAAPRADGSDLVLGDINAVLR
jgi:hypothetical protein